MCLQGRESRLIQGLESLHSQVGPEAGLWDWPRIERPARLAHLDAHQ